VPVPDDDSMDLTDGDAVGNDEGVAKNLAEKVAHIAQLDACVFEFPGKQEQHCKLVAERDELKARLEATKSPISRGRASKKLMDKAKAAFEKAESSFTASKQRMAKAIADETSQQEKHGADMRAAELLVAEHEGAWAEASQQVADKVAKEARQPAKAAEVSGLPARDELPIPPGNDVEAWGIVARMRATREAAQLEQLEYDTLMRDRAKAAPAAPPAAAPAAGEQPVQAPGGAGLQPSDTELAKDKSLPARSTGRASPYGTSG
jgi:hypothetical protein